MSESDYIGRGEDLSKKIFLRLIDNTGILEQVSIISVILPEDYEILDPEIQKHKFDFVLLRNNKKHIIIEINYKHKEKASKKWNNIFVPLIEKAGYDYVTVNDYDCREHGLFWLNSKKEHADVTWDDFRDIIDALEVSGIQPNVNPFVENED